MLNRRIDINDYKMKVDYTGPIGLASVELIWAWLLENVGKEDYDWYWLGYCIALDNREDMVALKLKFGL
jgi:hypothetical protein